ncbi:MAG: ATP-binding protein [bacterium]
MKKHKLKVNISTRLLAYFLFVSILPIFFLAITSAILIDSSLNEKLTRDLNAKSEYFLKRYNQSLIDIPVNKLKTLFSDNKTRNKFDFVVILDKNNHLLYKYIKNQENIRRNIKTLKIKQNTNLADLELKSQKNKFSSAILNNYDINSLQLIKNTNLNKNSYLFINYSVKKFKINNKERYLILGKLPENDLLNNESSEKEIIGLIEKNGEILYSNLPINDFSQNISHFFEVSNIKINNNTYASIAIPLLDYNDTAIAKLIIATPSFNFDEIKQKNRILILKIALLMTLGGVSLAYILARSITAPITKISNAVYDLESGNYSSRVNIRTNDELGLLASSFNGMAEVLEERTEKIMAFNELLINQNNKIEAILNSSADGILTINSNGKINATNAKIIEWSGLDETELINKIFYEVINYNDSRNYPVEYASQVKDFKNFVTPFPNACLHNVNTGKIINLDITYSEIKSENTHFEKNYVLVLRDITKKKEFETLKEDFVATLTHDLRVPVLANVQTFEHLMKGCYGELSEKQNFIFEQLTSSNKDLLKMVNVILDSYKYEAGKYSLLKRNFNLNKLIKECTNEISALAREKKHTLIFNNELIELSVNADKHEIKRVILNLLSNAINYTPHEGTIKITAEKNSHNIIVSIEDNGIGINQSSLENLFERYSKGGKTLRKVGTGLGLYLSKQIIDAHKGKIWVESTKDLGSTFHFSIPLD